MSFVGGDKGQKGDGEVIYTKIEYNYTQSIEHVPLPGAVVVVVVLVLVVVLVSDFLVTSGRGVAVRVSGCDVTSG